MHFLRSSRLFRKPRRGGFTVLELMVSMAVLAILVLILATIVDSSTKLWKQSENRVDSYREARAALNLISKDLQSLLKIKEVTPSSPRFLTVNTDAGLPGTAIGPNQAGNIFFLTSVPTSDQKSGENKSDLCTVGYFLAYDAPSLNQQKKSMNLYRFFRGSDQTITVFNSADPIAQNYTTGPTGEEVLARNIVGLTVKAMIVDPTTGNISEYPNATGLAPTYIDIELVALNNDAGQRLDSEAKLLDKSSPTFKREARSFSTRVYLSSASPQP